MRSSKPCAYCEQYGHTQMTCYIKPKNRMVARKQMRKVGKVGREWLKVRAEWFLAHPAPFYSCYLCGEQLTLKETTLDHVKSRSRRPDLRYDLNNLKPCCYRCNLNKGSKDLEELYGRN